MKHYLLLLLIFLISCTANKEAAEFMAQPDWVKQKPIIPDYYIGIGSAKKVGTSVQYTAEARKNALADLSGEVSTQVSSTSVLHTIETDYGHAESFNQRIETNTTDYLEGFEPVASYETEDLYWIYFRVSKEDYKTAKEKKKNEAIEMALSKYIAGQNEQNMNKPTEALSFYLQGLQAIKGYLQENTPANYDGNEVDIGNETYLSVNHIITDLAIQSEEQTIELKRGEKNNVALYYNVLYNNSPVQGIPVDFKYSGGYLKDNSDVSNAMGKVQVSPGIIYSKNKEESIQASIDLEDIAQNAVDDLFIRGLLSKRTIEPSKIEINILAPSMAIKIKENSCLNNECDRINSIFSKNVISEGYSIGDQNEVDYMLSVSISVNDGESVGGLTSVYLNGDLRISDKDGTQIWTKEVNDIKGVEKSISGAREKAFSEFLNSFDRIWIKQGLDNIK